MNCPLIIAHCWSSIAYNLYPIACFYIAQNLLPITRFLSPIACFYIAYCPLFLSHYFSVCYIFIQKSERLTLDKLRGVFLWEH
jgi:hypothetical protein